jgi:hypothetical protein
MILSGVTAFGIDDLYSGEVVSSHEELKIGINPVLSFPKLSCVE